MPVNLDWKPVVETLWGAVDAETGERVTPYRVICRECGSQQLSHRQYEEQMQKPNARWSCPKCGDVASFDDEFYEQGLEISE